MIIIGHKNIPYESISVISRTSEISTTLPNQTIAFKYDVELVQYCFENSISCIVLVENIKEAIFCNSLQSKFIATSSNLSKKIQNIAENYIFDSKVLEIINDDNEIENIALNGIDGIIYDKLLKGILWEQ